MGDKSSDSGLFGWKNWSIPDSWTAVARDRTPLSPDAGKYDLETNVEMSNRPGSDAKMIGDDFNPVRYPQMSIGYELMRTWQPPLKNIFTEMGAYVMSSQVNNYSMIDHEEVTTRLITIDKENY